MENLPFTLDSYIIYLFTYNVLQNLLGRLCMVLS